MPTVRGQGGPLGTTDPRSAGPLAAAVLFVVGIVTWAALPTQPGCLHINPEFYPPTTRRERSVPTLAVGPAPDRTDVGVPTQDAGADFVRPSRVVALAVWTPVHREPHRDAHNAGYLRAGSIVDVIDGPHGQDGCVVHRDHPEGGWYQISGGYVCVGGAMAVPWPTRRFTPPAQPDLDAGMPYTYAIEYGHAVMYRHPPSNAELHEAEPWRYAPRNTDAGILSLHTAVGEQGDGGEGTDPSVETLTPVHDAGQTHLADLAGDRGGPVIRRMLTGMYVALDRTVRDTADGELYWRTQSAGFVRMGALSPLRSWPTFRGMEITATQTLPVAWMVSETGWDYMVAPSGRSVSSHRRMPRLSGVVLAADPPITQGGQTYYRTTDGRAVNGRNIRRATLRSPPDGVGANERWIDVDLDQQVLVAYEGPRPVYATLVSSGRRDEHRPERNFETPAGSFRIQSKHVTTTMDGDTATDGPYSIEDVPWVMYFQGSYALHAAFWHNFFGWRMSHGCVNLAPGDARRLFLWAEPALPAGWHGVFANDQHPGSRVELRHSLADVPEEGRPAGAAHAVPESAR